MVREDFFLRLLATFIASRVEEFNGNKEYSFLVDLLESLKDKGFTPIEGLRGDVVVKYLIDGTGSGDTACWLEDDLGYLHCSHCGYEVPKVQRSVSCPKCKAYIED